MLVSYSALATRLLVAAALALVASGPASAQTTITFNDFSDLSDFTLNGRAGTVGNPISSNGRDVLRLTESAGGQSGSAFLTDAISLADASSFSTAFSFQISNPGGGSDSDGIGADGLVFVVQTVANNVGSSGGGIGYQGIPNSVGVEFDTWNNGAQDGSNGNHIGINLAGNISSVALYNVADRMNDGDVLYAWVDYDGSTEMLEVRFSDADTRPAAPVLSYNVDLPAVLGQTDAFVGFTSGTGGAYGDHDILSWTFTDTFAPVGVNQPPVPQGIADGDIVDVEVGSGSTVINFSFISPEAGQTTTIALQEAADTDPAAAFFPGGFTFDTTPGNPATATASFSVPSGISNDTGDYDFIITATDDGSPVESTEITITVRVSYPPTLSCDFGVSFYINEFMAQPTDNYFQIYSSEPGPVDLSGCSFVAFDALTEQIVVSQQLNFVQFPFVEPHREAGDFFSGLIPSGPGAIAIVKGTPSLGSGVGAVLGDVVNAIVYYNDGGGNYDSSSIFGICGEGTLIGGTTTAVPCNSSAGSAALAEALARLGNAVASERDGALDLSVVPAPNPVSGQGSVSFGLAEGTDVTVAVYDALGRRVAVLAEGPYGPGRHTIGLDASSLPAGVYVVRVAGPNEARTARLTVAR